MKIQQLFINRVVQKPNIGTKKQIGKPGELHNYRIIKNEQLIKKIMCVNKLNIPDVLIDIVKDYLYYSSDFVLQRMIMQKINQSIKYSLKEMICIVGDADRIIYQWDMNYYVRGELTYTYFETNHKLFRHALSVSICTHCGNYANNNMYDDDSYSYNVLCKCSDHPFYQEENEIQTFNVKKFNYNQIY